MGNLLERDGATGVYAALHNSHREYVVLPHLRQGFFAMQQKFLEPEIKPQ
jgi:hypothetical protein